MLVREVIDIEEDGAGDMGGLVFCFRVPVRLRQIPGGVGYADVRRAQMLGEPVGRNER